MSPNPNYARGAQRERELAERLREQGWVVVRAAGSHGIDLVAVRDGAVRFIEVKTDAAGPFSHFGPASRAEFLDRSQKAGASAELCWWPADRQGPRWYRGPDAFPGGYGWEP